MNETERATLVEDLARATSIVRNVKPYDIAEDDDREFIRYQAETHFMPIIDRLLTDRAVPEPDADAIERAASAIHRVDVSMFPDSVRHIPARTVYRDRASAALQAVAVPEPDADAVERAARAIAEMYPPRQSKHDGYVKPVWDMADIEDLAEHVLQAAGSDADWLDEALDSVHPETYVSYVIWESGSQGSWRACIRWPDSRMSARWGYPHLDSIGHGPTRHAAIEDAVAKARKENDNAS